MRLIVFILYISAGTVFIKIYVCVGVCVCVCVFYLLGLAVLLCVSRGSQSLI